MIGLNAQYPVEEVVKQGLEDATIQPLSSEVWNVLESWQNVKNVTLTHALPSVQQNKCFARLTLNDLLFWKYTLNDSCSSDIIYILKYHFNMKYKNDN